MKANGNNRSETDMECKNGLMVLSIKETGLKTKLTEKAN